MTDDVASEKWVARMRSLPVDEQAGMLAGAVKLLQHPEALSDPLETDLRILAEQVYLALGASFRA